MSAAHYIAAALALRLFISVSAHAEAAPVWTFKNCNRVEVRVSPRSAAEKFVPALSSLGEGDLRLQAGLKSSDKSTRTLHATILSPDGKRTQELALQSSSPVIARDGALTRRLWIRDFSRHEKQSFHGEGITRLVYEESWTTDPAHVKSTISIATMNDPDAKAVVGRLFGNGGIEFTLFQFDSEGGYLERMIDTKPVGNFLSPSLVITQQQVLGQCGSVAATGKQLADWNRGIPPSEAVSDAPSAQRAFAGLIPYMHIQPLALTR